MKTFIEYIKEDYGDHFLYHGTSRANAENIMENGFTEETYWGDRYTAETYAYSYPDPVLIQLEQQELEHLLEPNTTLLNYYEENQDEDEDYDDIVVNWYKSDRTIKDSMDIFGSVILQPCYISITEDNIIDLSGE
jgi:alkylated DNA repair dioxygenase AlkB